MVEGYVADVLFFNCLLKNKYVFNVQQLSVTSNIIYKSNDKTREAYILIREANMLTLLLRTIIYIHWSIHDTVHKKGKITIH